MPNTPTTNFSLLKPAAGDFDWDDEINGNLDSIDSLLFLRTPIGSDGAVQFKTGSALNGDAANFYWDNAGKRLGIGTNAPATNLDVRNAGAFNGIVVHNSLNNDAAGYQSQNTVAIVRFGAGIGIPGSVFAVYDHVAGMTRLLIDASGNVGIGTTGPTQRFTVADSGNFIGHLAVGANNADQFSFGAGNKLLVVGDGSANNMVLVLYAASTQESYIMFKKTANTVLEGGIAYTHATDAFKFFTASAERMRITSVGAVGIGTTDPTALDGGIRLAVESSSSTAISVLSTDVTKRIFIRLANEVGGYMAVGKEGSVGGGLVTGSLAYASVITTGSVRAMHFGTSDTVRMTVDQNGLIGIGTVSPTVDLEIVRAGLAEIRLRDTVNVITGKFTVDGSTVLLGAATAHPLRFSTSDTERVRIDAAGNVGIGTSSPTQPLHVRHTNARIRLESIGSGAGQYALTDFVASSIQRFTLGLDGDLSSAKLSVYDVAFGGYTTVWSGGFVGVGTSSPAAKLDVNGTIRTIGQTTPASGEGLELSYSASISQILSYDRTGGLYKALTVSALTTKFNDNTGATTLSLNTNGNGKVGINTITPAEALDVVGSIQLAGNLLPEATGTRDLGSTTRRFANLYLASVINYSTDLQFSASGVEKVRITTGGNVGIGSTTPAQPLNVNKAGGASDTINLANAFVYISDKTLDAGIAFQSTLSSPFAQSIQGLDSLNNKMVLALNPAGANVGVGTTTPANKLSVVGAMDVSGNVGIGTTSPATDLEIVRAGSTELRLRDATNVITGKFLVDGSTVQLGSATAHPLRFTTSDTERMRIDSVGMVGIGTSNPEHDLDVSKADIGSVVDLRVENTDNTNSASGVRSIAQVAGSLAGDPRFVLTVEAIQEWNVGIDNSDSDKFMIGEGSTVGTDPRITVMVGGAVGIGTTNPTALDGGIRLAVESSLTTALSLVTSTVTNRVLMRLTNEAGGYSTFGKEGSAGGDLLPGSSAYATVITTGASSRELQFGTADTLRMTITNIGRVGIATAAPTGALDVAGVVIVQTSAPFLRVQEDGSFASACISGKTDTDTGINWSGTDAMLHKAGGANIFDVSSFGLRGGFSANTWGLRQVTVTASDPSVVPNQADPNTGLGWAAADKMTLVTGGAERVRVDDVGNVGIGGAPVATALLDMTSTSKGFRAPQMTTAQRDAIVSPANGLFIYNTTTATYNFFNGATWQTLTTGGVNGHVIKDEGVGLAQRGNLNFVGVDVTVTDDAGNDASVVTITSTVAIQNAMLFGGS